MNEITGAQVLAEMLQGYGVTHMFMVPAILRRTCMEIERRTKIQVIRTHGEKSAAYMADGYARASGRPGVCGAQIIGALNIAAGLRDAWLAHSPVIALTGGRDPKTNFQEGLPGGRRRSRLRACDQVQCHHRCGRALPRHASSSLSCRRFGDAGAGASAVPRQRGPD